MADSTVKVNFIGDSSRLKRAVDESESHLGRLASGIGDIAKKAAIGFAAVGAGVAAFSKSAIDAASSQAEALSKVNVVFKEQSKEIEAWADTAATAFGQSKTQALQAAGTYGNLFKAFGIGQKESTKMSKSLVELASDLASFNDTTVDEALVALRSGLSGEAEPLKRYGVAINDARLKTEAMSLGLIKSTKEALTPAAKAQASYSLILKDTALAQGDFSRTADGLANKSRTLKSQFSDLQAEIGAKLLPVAVAVAGALSDKLFPAIERISNDPKFKQFLKDVGDTAKDVFGWIKENVPPVLAAIGKFIREDVVPAIQELAGWVRDELGPALGKMAASFREEIWPVLKEKVLPALHDLWMFIKDKVIPVLGDIVVFIVEHVIPGFFKIVNWIATVLIPKIAEITVVFWNFVIDVKEVAEDIGDAFRNIGEAIWAPFKWAFEQIMWAWDHSIGPIIDKITSLPGGSTSGIDLVKKIPGFAMGGLVPGPVGVPQLAVVHGGERVLTPGQQGGGTTVIFELDGKILARAVVNESNNSGGLPIRVRAAS